MDTTFRPTAEPPDHVDALARARSATASVRDTARDMPDLVADSFRLALTQERENVRKAYFEMAELRQRLTDAERRNARLRDSLANKLGEVIVKTRTAKDWFTLSFRLFKTYQTFLRRRTKSARTEPITPLPTARLAAALHQASLLMEMRGHATAAQWVRSNVRNLDDRAHVFVNLGFAALPDNLGAAAEFAAESTQLQPSSARIKALLLSIEASKAA